MSDIFLGYKSEDQPRAKIIAEAIESQGYSVWWDPKIPPGKKWEKVIEEELRIAKCVVVLWSEESVKSDWVKDEAGYGKKREILIPILIDKVEIPLGFGQTQAARLIDWQGAMPNPEFDKLLKSITELVGPPLARKVVIKIGTFNAKNLFLRYKFLATKKVNPAKFIKEGGRQNLLGFEFLDEVRRKNKARVILENDPDVICLQEVENPMALIEFNSKYLGKKYPYAMLTDGNDDRQIGIGILSKLKIGCVKTHQFDKDKKGMIFSRDCLEADILLDKEGKKSLTLFVNHLKSKFGGEEETSMKRERQATRIAEIIQERFDNLENADFIVLGDFNDTPDADCLKPLLDKPWVDNVVARLPKNEQWTHYWEAKHETNQFDYILLSRALSKKNAKVLPGIDRRGLADYAKAYKGPRLPDVGPKGTEASDHCAVFIKIST